MFYIKILTKKNKNEFKSPKLILDEPTSDIGDNNPMVLRLKSLIDNTNNNTDNSNSCSIGLKAPWGYGKTSIMKVLYSLLKEEKKYISIWNNIPRIDGHNKIVKEILNTILNSIKPYANTFQFKYYINNVTNKNSNFWINLFIHLNLFHLSSEEYYDKTKRIFTKIDKKVVLFLDDLDRLDRDEIFEVFKIIRNFADFPNLFFVVGFNNAKIIAELNNSENCEDYLKKYFNVIIPLPFRPASYLESNFKKYVLEVLPLDVAETINSISETIILEQNTGQQGDDMDLSPFSNKNYEYNLRNIFKSIRDLKSFLNYFAFCYNSISEAELKIPDENQIELIKYFYKFKLLQYRDEKLVENIFNNVIALKTNCDLGEKDIPKERDENLDFDSKINTKILKIILDFKNQYFNIRSKRHFTYFYNNGEAFEKIKLTDLYEEFDNNGLYNYLVENLKYKDDIMFFVDNGYYEIKNIKQIKDKYFSYLLINSERPYKLYELMEEYFKLNDEKTGNEFIIWFTSELFNLQDQNIIIANNSFIGNLLLSYYRKELSSEAYNKLTNYYLSILKSLNQKILKLSINNNMGLLTVISSFQSTVEARLTQGRLIYCTKSMGLFKKFLESDPVTNLKGLFYFSDNQNILSINHWYLIAFIDPSINEQVISDFKTNSENLENSYKLYLSSKKRNFAKFFNTDLAEQFDDKELYENLKEWIRNFRLNNYNDIKINKEHNIDKIKSFIIII